MKSTYNPGNIIAREYSRVKLFCIFFIDFLSVKEFKEKGIRIQQLSFLPVIQLSLFPFLLIAGANDDDWGIFI